MVTWENRHFNPALFRKITFASPEQEATLCQRAHDLSVERFPMPPDRHPLHAEVCTWRMIWQDAWLKGQAEALGLTITEDLPAWTTATS
jgi:hypothetical protein